MSAVLDLDQIACSGNGVVSVKPGSGEGGYLPALTLLTGLQQRALVQIVEAAGSRLLCLLLRADAVTASGSGEDWKAARGLSLLACHHLIFVCRQLLVWSGHLLFCSACVFTGQTVSVCEKAQLKVYFYVWIC